MPLFEDLKAEEFKELQKDVELVSFEAGDVICDEFERLRLDVSVAQRPGACHEERLAPAGRRRRQRLGRLRRGPAQGRHPPRDARGQVLDAAAGADATTLLGTADLAKLGPADRSDVIFGVNELLTERKLIDDPTFKKLTEAEPIKSDCTASPPGKGWSDGQVRQHNRLLLESLYSTGIRRRARHAGVETILSYCSPGDYFGEMGLMLSQPRTATCVAYGHPNHEGEVQLVKIPSKTFWRLMKLSPAVRDRVKAEIADRRKKTLTTLAKPVWEEANQVQFSEEFGKLGLIQGQQLMLIDLDRCTRCDECVRACVNTHGGQQTRLYLDGPRFGKYLVPTTCRSCLDPVCMIPCPVASIHRGDNREIVIEDWCIGCEACADACPYGSIRMHDLGLIRRKPRLAFSAGNGPGRAGEWFTPKFRDDKWLQAWRPSSGSALAERLRARTPPPSASLWLPGPRQVAVLFRREFELDRKLLRPESRFKFEVHSRGSEVRVWVNGRELTLDDRVKQGRHGYSVPPLPKKPEKPEKPTAGAAAAAPVTPQPPAPATDFLCVGRNVVAVQVLPTAKPGEVLLRLRLTRSSGRRNCRRRWRRPWPTRSWKSW